MIQLAIADSAVSRKLLTTGELTVDYLEVHGPHVATARASFPDIPMLLHNSLYNWSLAHPDALQQQQARKLTLQHLAQTRTPWFSIHCGFSAASVTFRDNAMQADSPTLEPETLFHAFCHTITQVQTLLDVPLLIENLDYCPTGAYEHICDPAFITAVLDATDTALLLDLAHAQVSAAACGISVHNYLQCLPLQRVTQVHLSSPRWYTGRLLDVHEVLQDQDYALLEYVLAHTKPWAITLEYTRAADALLDQMQRLRTLLASCSTTSSC